MLNYTLNDLQEFDERCTEKAAKWLPLPTPEILFHLSPSEEIYDIAARGLPGRYSHYQFGRRYEYEKKNYDRGRGRIYELIINTRPVHAYLLDGNSFISQLVVMAHCQGHAYCFEHNKYFEHADKNILSRVRAAAERIDEYIHEVGRMEVEDFIDCCESLSLQRSLDQFAKPRKPKEPKLKYTKFDSLFPDEVQERKKKYEVEKEEFKQRYPREPVRDILEFIENEAPWLEDWQRDIISIIRTERDYFIPQMRTQVVNEGLAVYSHINIVQELMAEDSRFTTEQFTEFASMNSRVLHPHIEIVDGGAIRCKDLNPYLLGYTILKDVQRLCENPTKEERTSGHDDYVPWAGEITWSEKLTEISQTYDDVTLIAEFLTPKICEQAKLFMVARTRKQFQDLHISDEEFKEVYDTIVAQKRTFNIPLIEIVNADGKNQGELWLTHRHEGIGLDDEYTRGTLMELVKLWQHPVAIETIDKQREPLWYRATPTTPNLPGVSKSSKAP